MKTLNLIFSIIFILNVQTIFAVDTWFKGYKFEADVKIRKHGVSKEYSKEGKQFIYVKDGDEYSIQIKNPLPVSIGVVVSVDGLNVIDGTRKRPGDSSKWVLKPYSSLNIRGWQTGKKSLRRFYFTRGKHSYANWKEKYDNRPYTQNLGVIGIAYFWDSRALAYKLNPPQPFADGISGKRPQRYRNKSNESGRKSQRAEKVGTGMGHQEYNRVKKVNFNFDTGMYSNKDVLKIFYEFKNNVDPKPFKDDDKGFAPEMNRIIRKVFGKGRWNSYNINSDNNPVIKKIFDHPYLRIARSNVLLARKRQIQILLQMYKAEHNEYPRSIKDLILEGYVDLLNSDL